GQQLAVDEQSPDLFERHVANQFLDVDAAVAQRATGPIGLGDLGGEGDDALEARLDFGRGGHGAQRRDSLASSCPSCCAGPPPSSPRWSAPATADAIAPDDSRPFAGVPIAIKDNRSVAGMPLTMGSDAFGEFVTGRDAYLVRRLREAGFVI